MTQTQVRGALGKISDYVETEYKPNSGAVPRLSGDIRHLVPRLGLREYWYPLCGASRVKRRKPLRVKMLGEDICVFRAKRRRRSYRRRTPRWRASAEAGWARTATARPTGAATGARSRTEGASSQNPWPVAKLSP